MYVAIFITGVPDNNLFDAGIDNNFLAHGAGDCFLHQFTGSSVLSNQVEGRAYQFMAGEIIAFTSL